VTEQVSVDGALESLRAAFVGSNQAIPTPPFPAFLALSVSPKHYNTKQNNYEIEIEFKA
jgi:hypothetical protein